MLETNGPDLNDELKAQIVVSLAMFVRPKQIIQEFAEQHKISLTAQQLSAYDPATVAGRRLRPEFQKLFQETRERYHSDLTTCAFGTAIGRARFLEQVAYAALEGKQPGRAMEAVEMTAKDLGGSYLKGLTAKDLSDDQIRRLLGLPTSGAPEGSGGAGPDGNGG